MNWTYRDGFVIIPNPKGGNNVIPTKDFAKMSYAPIIDGGLVKALKEQAHYVSITAEEFLTIQEEIKNL